MSKTLFATVRIYKLDEDAGDTMFEARLEGTNLCGWDMRMSVALAGVGEAIAELRPDLDSPWKDEEDDKLDQLMEERHASQSGRKL